MDHSHDGNGDPGAGNVVPDIVVDADSEKTQDIGEGEQRTGESKQSSTVGVPLSYHAQNAYGGVLERAEDLIPPGDPNLVTWDSPEDPANPKNWSSKRKWVTTFAVSCFAFMGPLSSSMVAPALTSIAKAFHITSELESQMTLSIFVLAFAFGPLIFGPLSEIYGRVNVLQAANLFYFIFNTACGTSQSKGQLIAFRFLAGLGGSAALSIGGGTLSDLFLSHQRGKAMGIYTLAPLLGPALGPIAGGFISENTTWRWTFYATSIADAVIAIAGLLVLQETYPARLLKLKRNKLQKETGNLALHTEYDDDTTLIKILSTALIRPFRLFGTQIIIQVLAVYMAFVYGTMYLVLSTFPRLWESRYGESIGVGSLNYISLGLGFFLGTQMSARISDKVYQRLRSTNKGVGRPEFRVPIMIPAAFLVPIGLFWYGWTAQAHTHWVLPNIGATIFALGSIVATQAIQTYIVDAYTRYAASALGAATLLRSLAGFGFPLFAPYMYAKLNYGWGNTLLACLAIVIGLPAPVLLWKFGTTLRAKSTFAAGA